MTISGITLIAHERYRQIMQEGWTPEHVACELAPAAWPWDKEWWKPSKDQVRNLVKAGALIAAEIDRLQRKESHEPVSEKQNAGGNGIPAGDARPGIESVPASGEAMREVEVQPSDIPISRSTSEAPPPWFAAALNEARQKFEDAIIGDLASVANRHSFENESDTPDFILARFMRDCLLAFGTATVANVVWHSSTPGENDPSPKPEVKRGFLICRQCGAELYEVTPMRSRLVDGPCGSCVSTSPQTSGDCK